MTRKYNNAIPLTIILLFSLYCGVLSEYFLNIKVLPTGLASVFGAIIGGVGMFIFSAHLAEKEKITQRTLAGVFTAITAAILLAQVLLADDYIYYAPVWVTILVLGVSSAIDICSYSTYTVFIYAGTVVTMALECINIHYADANIYVYIISCVIFFALCLLLEHICKDRWIGGGDLDATALIFVSNHFLGVVLLICSIVLVVKKTIERKMLEYKLKKGKISISAETDASENSSGQNGLFDKSMPFVPIMFIIYLLTISMCI